MKYNARKVEHNSSNFINDFSAYGQCRESKEQPKDHVKGFVHHYLTTGLKKIDIFCRVAEQYH